MKYLVSLLLIANIFAQLPAQDSITVFSLQRSIDESIKNNIQLKQNELNVETAEVNKRLAYEARYPNLNGNVSPGLNLGRTVDPSTNQFRDQNYTQSSFSISSNLTIFNGFRLINIVRQNKQTLEAVKYELKDFKNTLILNILNAYVQILYNKEALKNAQNQFKVTDSQKQRTEKLVRGGVLAEINLLNLVSQSASDESNTISAENQLNIAKLNLIQYMNLPLENYNLEQFDIEIPAFIDTTQLSESPREIYNMAEKTQPSVKGAELRLRSSNFAYDAAKGNMYPRLTLSAQVFSFYSSLRTRLVGVEVGPFQRTGSIVNNDPTLQIFQPTARFLTENTPLTSQLRENFAQSISMSLIIPIYNNRQARGGTEIANINRKNADLNYQNSKVQLRKKIEQAYVDAKAAQKKHDATTAQVVANEEAFRVTEKRFNAGVINSVDYTVSSNTLNLSRSSLIQAKYDLILKKKILEFYKYNDIQL